MLGWFFIVRRLDGAQPSDEVARWQSGLHGLDWVRELAERGEASGGGNGYPMLYRARARDVLPVLGDPPHATNPWRTDPGDTVGDGWLGRTTVHWDVARACAPDEWLEVTAWDES